MCSGILCAYIVYLRWYILYSSTVDVRLYESPARFTHLDALDTVFTTPTVIPP